MRQSLKKTSPVVEPLIPIFGSIRPTSKPGVLASTTKAEIPDGDAEAACRAALRALLDRDEADQRARPEPAVLLLEEDPEELVLAEELDDVPRELGRLVDLRRPRRDPLARERAHEVADLALLVGERVGRHGGSLEAVDVSGVGPPGPEEDVD